MEAVRTYSIEKNFSLLRCRNYIEALDDQPRTPIIEGGEKSVPFLLVQLNENVDEWQKETAIYLLSVIDQDDKVSNRPDVIANIEKIVSEMKKEQAKSSSTKWLQEMKDRRK